MIEHPLHRKKHPVCRKEHPVCRMKHHVHCKYPIWYIELFKQNQKNENKQKSKSKICFVFVPFLTHPVRVTSMKHCMSGWN